MSLISTAKAEECTPASAVGDTCSLAVSDFHPTQLYVGFQAAEKKRQKLKDKRDEGDLDDYLKKHRIPVVIGNGNQFYLVDHHHLLKAASELGLSKMRTTIIAKINLRGAQFWASMEQRHYAYLRDNENHIVDPSELPRTIDGCKDDPYRSLAGEVRDEGGFSKDDGDYFIEFKWAAFFRGRIDSYLIVTNFDKAVKEAMKLAQTSAASRLPGAN